MGTIVPRMRTHVSHAGADPAGGGGGGGGGGGAEGAQSTPLNLIIYCLTLGYSSK